MPGLPQHPGGCMAASAYGPPCMTLTPAGGIHYTWLPATGPKAVIW
jgi:hypothetical protein